MSLIIVRQGSTGTYHRGFANSPGITLCNHSGQRRRMWTRPAKPAEIQRASESVFSANAFRLNPSGRQRRSYDHPQAD